MKLAKAVQIATEAISLQRLKIAFDANLLKVYHVETTRTRICAELYQRYSEAINLLNSLDTKSAAAADHYVTMPLVTGPPSGADHTVPNLPIHTGHAFQPPDAVDHDLQRRK